MLLLKAELALLINEICPSIELADPEKFVN